MNDLTLLGPWVRRFLLEHLVAERNLARNTQRSYRDALILLIPFVANKLHRSVDRLTVVDVSADLVRLFLTDLEQSRECAIATRNQRLAAIHALARFVGEHSPEHIAWCGQVRSIPFKKASKAVVPYLDKPQMDALLGAPNRQSNCGRLWVRSECSRTMTACKNPRRMKVIQWFPWRRFWRSTGGRLPYEARPVLSRGSCPGYCPKRHFSD